MRPPTRHLSPAATLLAAGRLTKNHGTWGDAGRTDGSSGTRTVTLKVTDSYGRTDTATKQVSVG
jgi:hypothetical protein